MSLEVNVPEPAPKAGMKRVLDLVQKDLEQRAEIGRAKYGTYLETNNGRYALLDAYQEALDLAMYLRQELEERTPFSVEAQSHLLNFLLAFDKQNEADDREVRHANLLGLIEGLQGYLARTGNPVEQGSAYRQLMNE